MKMMILAKYFKYLYINFNNTIIWKILKIINNNYC